MTYVDRSYPTGARAFVVGAAMAFMAGLATVAGPATTASASESVKKTTPVTSHLTAASTKSTSSGKNPTSAKTTSSAKATTFKATPKVKAAKTTNAKAVAKPAGPSAGQLHPAGIPGGQESFTVTGDQLKNARSIMQAGQKMGLPPRAWVVAIATSMQESKLENLGHLGDINDHDSLGLFQQRPSSGWGTPEQITNPEYSASSFYKGLVNVSGWSSMPLTDAAQTVQVSAYPDAYAKWEKQAGELVRGFFGGGPYANQAASLK